jgi:uncharacterized membrane protein HdeD (DUF308 family)
MRVLIEYMFDKARQDEIRSLLYRNWWAVALRGLLALTFGVIAFVWPSVTLVTLVILVAAYFIADGVFAIVAAVRAARRHGKWWPFILEGVINIAAGVVIAAWPQISVYALMYVLAIWAIFTGVLMFIAGGGIGRGTPRWLLLLAGILSVVLGVLMISQPAAGVLALAWWVGAYVIGFGALLLGLAVWLWHRGRGLRSAAFG